MECLEFRSCNQTNHLVILNWNTRASEIVNDLLYCPGRQKVVVLVETGKPEIEREIEERLMDTIRRENHMLYMACRDLPAIEGHTKYRKNKIRKNVVVIVREGDIFSAKQLYDIALERARYQAGLFRDEKEVDFSIN